MGLFAALVWTHRVAVEAHMPEPGGKDGVSARIIGGRPGAEAGASPRSGFGERVASLLRSDPNTNLVKLAAVDAVSLLPLPSATGCMQGGLDGAIDLQVDADGLLYVAAPWSTTEMSLRVECPGYQTVRWSGRMPRMPVVDLGLVPLLRVGGVVGSVLQHGRVPMAGVEVVVERRDADAGLAEGSWQTCGTRIATTDSAGRFSIPQLEVGPWRVHLQAPFSRSAPADFQVVAGELAEVEVVLPQGADQLRGRATDTMGRVLAGVYVGVEDQSAEAMLAKTDEHGRFWLVRRVDAPKAPQLRLLVRDYDGVTQVAHTWSEEFVRWGDDGLDVRFRRRDPVRVRVTDAAGHPVAHFRASCRWPGRPDGVREVAVASNSETGVVTLERVPPGRCTLRIDELQPDRAFSVEKEVDLPPMGGIEIPVVLAASVRSQVVVVDQDDEPVVACRVEFVPAGAGLPADPNMASSNGMCRPLGSWITDAKGTFEALCHATTPMTIVVRGPGCVPQTVEGATLVDGSPLRIQVQRGGAIQGKIVPQAAVDFMRVDSLGRLQEDEWRIALLPVGLPAARATSCAIASDGSFEAEGLPLGEWRARLLGPRVHGDLGILVAANPVRRLEFAAEWVMPTNVRGLVVLPSELLARGASLSLVNERAEIEVPVGRDGLFRLRAPNGAYRSRIVVSGLASEPPSWFDFRELLELPPGDRSVTLVPQMRRVRLRMVDTTGLPMVGLKITLDVEMALGRWRTYTADGSGCVVLDPAPTGPFKILHAGPQGMRELRTIDVVADGEHATIVVP
jgi:hypothetical protein